MVNTYVLYKRVNDELKFILRCEEEFTKLTET